MGQVESSIFATFRVFETRIQFQNHFPTYSNMSSENSFDYKFCFSLSLAFDNCKKLCRQFRRFLYRKRFSKNLVEQWQNVRCYLLINARETYFLRKEIPFSHLIGRCISFEYLTIMNCCIFCSPFTFKWESQSIFAFCVKPKNRFCRIQRKCVLKTNQVTSDNNEKKYMALLNSGNEGTRKYSNIHTHR